MSEDDGLRLTNGWTARINDLQEMTNDSARFLAAFDVRKAQNCIASLLDAVGVAKAAIMPRKKFAFSRKSPVIVATATAIATATTPVQQPQKHTLNAPTRAADFEEDEYTIEDLVGKTVVIESGTFSAEGAATVVRLEAALALAAASGAAAPTPLGAELRRARALAGGRDVRIQRCTDCTFILLDVLRAVRADSLTRCRIITSAVAGSLLLHGATDCVFVVAARQFRLHKSTRCDFFIRTRSHPIIEDCSVFRFAPYPAVGTRLDADLADSDLGPRAASASLWKAVDDFKWHRAQHSPNWREMTDEERIAAKATMLPQEALDRGVTINDSLLLEGAVTTEVTTVTALPAPEPAPASAPSTAAPVAVDADDEL